MIKLDILSDPICPWCYIGKTKLDRALEARPDHPFEIEWHPFQLNPDMPKAGMDRRRYLESKFGSRDRAIAVYAQVEEAALEAGLEIDFERMRRTPNTLDAHRVIHWAGLEGRQTPMVSALFRAYFTQGQDIGDREVLLDLVEEIGLDRDMIRKLIESEADRESIIERDVHARGKGVTGVPTFVVAHRHVVVGAQPAEMWVSVIDELLGRTQLAGDDA